jgi:hypothetical protein
MFVPGVNDMMFAHARSSVLHKIFSVVAVAAKRDGESAKLWHCRQHRCSDRWIKRHDSTLAKRSQEPRPRL